MTKHENNPGGHDGPLEGEAVERANEIAQNIWDTHQCRHMCQDGAPMRETIAKALLEAVAAERVECAKIVSDNWGMSSASVLSAIMSRHVSKQLGPGFLRTPAPAPEKTS